MVIGSKRGVFVPLLVLAALVAADLAAATEARRVLVLDMQFDSSAADGQTPEMEATDRARLAMVEKRLKDRVAASDAYEAVDAPDIAAAIAGYNIGACGRCELTLGRKAGADLVMVASVQKVSSMLLNMSVALYEVESGEAVAAGTGVLNANTDADWARAIDRIAERKLGLPDL